MSDAPGAVDAAERGAGRAAPWRGVPNPAARRCGF
jgi:hypothetical protein